LPVQAYFLLDRVKAITAEKPELAAQQLYKAILENDKGMIATFTKKELVTLVCATHTGMSPEMFQAMATAWLNTAKHPRFQQFFKTCTFQPMRELLDFLKAHGFKNFIVTGGGVEFVRAIAEEIRAMISSPSSTAILAFLTLKTRIERL
jgi:phosphoserine phosphatase